MIDDNLLRSPFWRFNEVRALERTSSTPSSLMVRKARTSTPGTRSRSTRASLTAGRSCSATPTLTVSCEPSTRSSRTTCSTSTSLLGQNENYYSREIRVRNALRENVTIDIERQFGRLPWVNIWDNRISKTFDVTDRQSIEATFDLFNTMNSNNVTAVRERHGSRFLEPTAVLAPRIFRLGVRYRF